jgi:hypothetical protein
MCLLLHRATVNRLMTNINYACNIDGALHESEIHDWKSDKDFSGDRGTMLC